VSFQHIHVGLLMAIAFAEKLVSWRSCHTQGPIDAVDWGMLVPCSISLLKFRREHWMRGGNNDCNGFGGK
jgi:hypothetical protein